MRFLRWIPPAIAAVALAVFPKWLMDDAYIVFRFGRNLAETGQLTWNPGLPPVEGYTGVFLPVYQSVFVRLGIDIGIATQILGVVSFFIAGFLLIGYARRINLQPISQALLSFLYFLNPFLYVHAFNGLETTFFIAIVLASFSLLHRALEGGQASGKETPWLVCLLLISLTRPEGMLLAGLQVATAALYWKRLSRTFMLRVLFIWIIPLFAYLLWKLFYYGDVLPNTFYAKRYFGFLNFSVLGQFTHMLLVHFGLPALLAIIFFCASPRRLFSFPKYSINAIFARAILPCSSLFILLAVFQYSRSHLQMGMAYRFMLPFFALLTIPVALLWDIVFREIKDTPRRPLWIALASLLLLAQGGVYAQRYRHQSKFVAGYKHLLETAHQPIGRLLSLLPDEEWIVVTDAGVIPWYARHRALDFGRLCDHKLAHERSLTNQEKRDYLFSYRPGAMVFVSYHVPPGMSPGAEPSVRFVDTAWMVEVTSPHDADTDPRFKDYVLFAQRGTDDYFLFVFLRKDLVKGACGDVRGNPDFKPTADWCASQNQTKES